MNTPFVTDLITALWLGFTVACIGSFLNVVAYRMPLGMSVIWKPSHCPKCSHAIRAYDNVPVFGWLWLRGRCRDCGEPISPRYAIVEFVMGLTFFLLAYVELFSGGANLPGGPISEFVGAVGNVWFPQWELMAVYGYHCALLSLLMCVVLIDLDLQRVPMRLAIFGVIVGFVPPLMGALFRLPLIPPSFLEVSRFSIKLICLIIGSLIGTYFWGRAFWRDGFPWDGRRINYVWVVALVWIFLGWQMLLFGYVLAFVISVLLRCARHWLKRIPVSTSSINLFMATTLTIIFWKQLSEISPW